MDGWGERERGREREGGRERLYLDKEMLMKPHLKCILRILPNGCIAETETEGAWFTGQTVSESGIVSNKVK